MSQEEAIMGKKGNVDELFLMTNKGKIYSKVISNTEKMLIKKALRRSFGNQVYCRENIGNKP